ncbi:MAG: MGH1-like glycoside hydrolase domain-containing protein [Christensenellaceae bacterium]
MRSHDGAYTERTVNFTGISAKVSTAEDEFSNCISPVCFYSLFAELKEGQAEKILRHFYDEKKFCGEYMLLSVAKNHPSWVEQDYWRGSIWPPMNSLVYRALNKQV